MNVSEYRVTMTHDGGVAKIVVTASKPAAAVDAVVRQEGAPRRSARLVEVRPLQFERTDDTWTPVPGDQWGRVDDQPVNVTVHTNSFAPDQGNTVAHLSTQELEWHLQAWVSTSPRGREATEELARRADVTAAVELWERLCTVSFVSGETQGQYTHSTAHLSPGREGGVIKRMPNREEIEALILSDGEETTYPEYEIEDGSAVYKRDTNPWSGDDRLYPVTLTLISCGDYHGSDVDAANNRALDGTPGVDVRQPNTGGQGSVFNVSTTVVGEMSLFENNHETSEWEREPAVRRADAVKWLENLVKAMEGLIDYALLDESAYSELIDELAEEAWSDHLENDTFDELSNRAPDEEQDNLVESQRANEENDAQVHAAYFGYEENEWSVESLGSGATNGRHEDAVKHVARTVFGWDL